MPSVQLYDRRRQLVGTLSADIVALLEQDSFSREAQARLDDLRRDDLWVRCSCGLLLHVVEGAQYAFLRRHPNQDDAGGDCGLCRAPAEDETTRERVATSIRPSAQIGLILATRRKSAPGASHDRNDARHTGTGKTQRTLYASAFAHMLSICERAGLTRYAPSVATAPDAVGDAEHLTGDIAWAELWGRIDAQLARVPLWNIAPHERAVASTLAHFAWLPGGVRRGDLRALNRQMLTKWRHPEYEPEGFIWAMFERAPLSGGLRISDLTIDAPPHVVRRIGATGPYLALGVASADGEDSSPNALPRLHRLLLYSIASPEFPVLVESSYEREVALLLRDLRVPFVKPVFDDADNLRPDFVLAEDRIILEVQGMRGEKYRERKARVHARLMQGDAYRNYELITYDAGAGERLDQFADRLTALIASRRLRTLGYALTPQS